MAPRSSSARRMWSCPSSSLWTNRANGTRPSLARYMATSAHQISRALSVASVGATAMPMLAPMLALTELRRNGSRRSCGQPVGDRQGVVDVAAGQDHGELVPAEANQQVPLAEDPSQPRAELSQQLVAGRVAERVVDLLEPVEIDEEEGQALGLGSSSSYAAKNASRTRNR